MTKCVTCGTELHPERAQKYNYCMAPECQEKNVKGLTIAAIGMNKAAEEFMILDEQARADLASGKYRDQRRGSFGTSPAGPARGTATATPARGTTTTVAQRQARRPGPRLGRQSPPPTRGPWTRSQEKLALLYNEQGLRPDEIARKLGLSPYLVTQIILNTRSRGKL